MTFSKVAVLGLGKVGALAATLLERSGFAVTGIDARPRPCRSPCRPRPSTSPTSQGSAPSSRRFEAVLSCLPYHLNREVARAAHAAGIHYFDLTEDVPTTAAIIEMSRTGRALMAPQCGLAPGFVGIVGADLAGAFDTCRSIRMRVGALPRNPTGLLGYAFNWSPEGVVTRVPQRLRGDRERRAQVGLADGVAGDGLCRGRQARGLHHLGRPRHDVRHLPRPRRQHRLQDHALSRPRRADELLLPRAR